MTSIKNLKYNNTYINIDNEYQIYIMYKNI